MVNLVCNNNMLGETGIFSSHEKVLNKFGDHQ
jgi:hypothetical protein